MNSTRLLPILTLLASIALPPILIAEPWPAISGIGSAPVDTGKTIPPALHLSLDQPVKTVQVSFPKDYCIAQAVSPADLSPDQLPDGYNYPVIQDINCEIQEVYYTDYVEKRALTPTYSLKRVWTIRNTCDPARQLIEHTQHFNTSITTTSAGINRYSVDKALLPALHRAFSLLQNKPNPFSGQTVIGFHLPEAAGITLHFTDNSGKLVRQIKGDYPSGYSEITVDFGDFPGAGAYYYTLSTANFHATRTMILVKK